MVKLGFTGTRHGMSRAQKDALAQRLTRGDVFEFHHGDCVGSDEQAHGLALMTEAWIAVHPPDKDELRAHCLPYVARGEVLAPKSYLERDRDIVDATEELFATPSSAVRESRSGTWYTVNYARTNNKLVTVVYPDGKTVVWEPWEARADADVPSD